MKFVRASPALLAAALLWASPASAQVLEGGHEETFGRLLGEGAPCPFRGASIESQRVEAHYECGEVVLTHRSTATRGATLAGAFAVEGPMALVDFLTPRFADQDALWATPVPQHDEVSILERASPYLAFALFLLFAGGFRRPDATLVRWPLWAAMVLLCAQAFAGPFGSLHEHHTFLARLDCAATSGCFAERPGWYAVIYSLYTPLLRMLPPTDAALSALSLALSLLALWSFYEWLCVATRKPSVAGAAALLLVLHPAVPRVAAAFTFWPMALALLFSALRMSALLNTPETRWRHRVGAFAAWALTWCTSVSFTALVPLGLYSLFLRREDRTLPFLACGGAAGAVALAYAAPFAGGATLEGAWLAFSAQPLFSPAIVPLGLALCAAAGTFVALLKPATRGWPLLLLAAAILGFPIAVGYPTVFLHGFPLLFFYAALAALTLSVPKAKALRLAALALVLGTYPFAHESRVIASHVAPLQRELRWLGDAIPALPPHARLVVGPVLHDALDGYELEGDPIEIRFPHRLHASHHDAPIVSYDHWLRDGAPLEGTIVYVGLAEQLFHPREARAGLRHRPEAGALLQRFEWSAVSGTSIDATDSRYAIARATTQSVDLRFIRPVRRR